METPMALQNSLPPWTMPSKGVQMREEGEQGCSAPFTSSNKALAHALNHSSHESYQRQIESECRERSVRCTPYEMSGGLSVLIWE